MEIPNQLFRSQDACVFEDYSDALGQSIESAAQNLRELLSNPENRYVKSGSSLAALNPEITAAMKELTKAFKGELVKSYKISK